MGSDAVGAEISPMPQSAWIIAWQIQKGIKRLKGI